MVLIWGLGSVDAAKVPFLCLQSAADLSFCAQQTGLDALKSQMPRGIPAPPCFYTPCHPSLGWCGGGALLLPWQENAALAEMVLR